MKFDREKFKTLVLHVIWKTSNVWDFGATKLNKVLWFSDARCFEAYGKSVTGETYTRQKFGPVPYHISEVLDELSKDELIQVCPVPQNEYVARHYVAHQPPDISDFSANELGFIDWWIKHVAEDHTAVSISEKSHDYGWQIAAEGEELPFEAYLAKRIRQPKEGEELDWAQAAAKELESR